LIFRLQQCAGLYQFIEDISDADINYTWDRRSLYIHSSVDNSLGSLGVPYPLIEPRLKARDRRTLS